MPLLASKTFQTGFEQVRAATIDDVGGILQLIQPLEEQGILLRRSRELLENEIGDFTVMERDGMIAACIALYPYAKEKTAEVACVATHPDYRSAKRASYLLQQLEQDANAKKLKSLFVLTTQTSHWFMEKGFVAAELSALPAEKQKLYNYQELEDFCEENLIFCRIRLLQNHAATRCARLIFL